MSTPQKQDEAVLELWAEARFLEARAEAEAIAARMGKPGSVRNVPCPCGSGKKYKRCCGLKARQRRNKTTKHTKHTKKRRPRQP